MNCPAILAKAVLIKGHVYLQTAVDRFNAHKKAIGEPERVKVVLRKSVKSIY